MISINLYLNNDGVRYWSMSMLVHDTRRNKIRHIILLVYSSFHSPILAKNAVHSLIPFCRYIHFNIIVPSTSGYSQVAFLSPWGYPTNTLLHSPVPSGNSRRVDNVLVLYDELYNHTSFLLSCPPSATEDYDTLRLQQLHPVCLILSSNWILLATFLPHLTTISVAPLSSVEW
jgi:hypothetical protein